MLIPALNTPESKVFLILCKVGGADSWVVTVITQESAHGTLHTIKRTLPEGICEPSTVIRISYIRQCIADIELFAITFNFI